MQIIKSEQLSEVELIYKNKVKAADRLKITSSRNAYDIFKTLFNPDTIEHHEEFYILPLNRANQVLGWYKISSGGISGTVVDVRMILQVAINTHASGLVVAHNHPSGQMVPSEQDKMITKKIKDCAQLLEISLLDHLIVSSEQYYSFSDEGLIY